jgi:hypothetical protein
VTEPLVLAGPEGAVIVAPTALERLVVQAAQSVEGAIEAAAALDWPKHRLVVQNS